jgi:hypothetical protein
MPPMHWTCNAGQQFSCLNNSITRATLSRGNNISVRIGKSNFIKFGVDYVMEMGGGAWEQFDRL